MNSENRFWVLPAGYQPDWVNHVVLVPPLVAPWAPLANSTPRLRAAATWYSRLPRTVAGSDPFVYWNALSANTPALPNVICPGVCIMAMYGSLLNRYWLAVVVVTAVSDTAPFTLV